MLVLPCLEATRGTPGAAPSQGKLGSSLKDWPCCLGSASSALGWLPQQPNGAERAPDRRLESDQ